MLKNLLLFELHLQKKQKAFVLLSILFLLLGTMVGSTGYAPANVYINSGHQIGFTLGLFTMSSGFIIMFFVISGAIRDKQQGFEEIIYSTSINKNQFFISRFIGVFVFSLLVYSFILPGFFLGTLFPGIDPAKLTHFSLFPYFWNWSLLVLPNVFICSAILYTVGVWTKNNMAVYATAILIYVLYLLCSAFLNSPIMASSVPASPESMQLAALLDPLGLSAFHEQTMYWTAFEKNNLSLHLGGFLLWNRVGWMVFSFLVLGLGYWRFTFKVSKTKGNKKTIETKNQSNRQYFAVETTFNLQQKWLSGFRLLRLECRNVLKSLPFLAINSFWLVIVFMEMYSRIYEGGTYNDSWYPFTNLLIELFSEPLPIFSLMLIVFYSGEIVWKERGLKINGMVDVLPVSNRFFFFSKVITVALLPMVLITLAIFLAVLFQLVDGRIQPDWNQYAALYYFQGASMLFYCFYAVFVQSIVNNKYLGMGITTLTIFFLGGSLSSYIGIEHPMLKLGYIPVPEFTNMAGFSGLAKMTHHMVVYWFSMGAVMVLISFKLWQRGMLTGYKEKLHQLMGSWKKEQITVLLVALLGFAGMGSIVYYNRNILMDYKTASDVLDEKESYEKLYEQYDDIARLHFDKMKTQVALFPSTSTVKISANYQLKNNSEEPIATVMVTEKIALDTIWLEGATLLEENDLLGVYLFEIKKPVLPGKSIGYGYALTKSLDGYETATDIVNNGSYLMHEAFEPSLVYRSGVEIMDNMERAKRGLPKKEEETISESHMHDFDAGLSKASYETIVSTENGQIAIGSGNLIDSWTEQGRNYFQYKVPGIAVPRLAYFSAAYEVRNKKANSVDLIQYFKKEHGFNIDVIENSGSEALAYCSKNFGYYPYKELRISEVPGHWGFGGAAHVGNISMVENNLYLIDVSKSPHFDLVAKRTIHEVAHQWWGCIMSPASTEGALLIIEGLAKYTELVVMDKMYGKKSQWQLNRTAHQRYFSGRAYADGPEPPIYLMEDESYLGYGKSLLSLASIKDLIGEKKVNQALFDFTKKFRDQPEMTATSLDLIKELKEEADVQQQILMDDWLKRVILYDLSIETASIKPLEGGRFVVEMQFNSSREEVQEDGSSKKIEINEPIYIGLFTNDPQSDEDKDVIYYQAHVMDSNTKTVKIIVDKKPKMVGIDPYGTRPDKVFTDNTYEF